MFKNMEKQILFFDYDSYKDPLERDEALKEVEIKCGEANCMVYIWVKEKKSFESLYPKKKENVVFSTDVRLLMGDILFTAVSYPDSTPMRVIRNVEQIDESFVDIVPVGNTESETSGKNNDSILFAKEVIQPERSSTTVQTSNKEFKKQEKRSKILAELRKNQIELKELLNNPKKTKLYVETVEILVDTQIELTKTIEKMFGINKNFKNQLTVEFLENYLLNKCVIKKGDQEKRENYIIKNNKMCDEYYELLKKKISQDYNDIDKLERKKSKLHDEAEKENKNKWVIYNAYNEVLIEKTKENHVKLEQNIDNNFFKQDVFGDGNCYYRAISYSIYGDQDYYQNVKDSVLNKYDIAYENLEDDQIKADLQETQLYTYDYLYDYLYNGRNQLDLIAKKRLKDKVSQPGEWGGTNVIIKATGLWLYETFTKHLIILEDITEIKNNRRVKMPGFRAISTNEKDKDADIYKMNADKYYYIFKESAHYNSYRPNSLRGTRTEPEGTANSTRRSSSRNTTRTKPPADTTRPSSSRNTTSRRATAQKPATTQRTAYSKRPSSSRNTTTQLARTPPLVDLTKNGEGFVKCEFERLRKNTYLFTSANLSYTMQFMKEDEIPLADVFYNEKTKQFKGKYNGDNVTFKRDKSDNFKLKLI